MNKTNSQEKKIRKKNIYILLAILAILIGHFALQLSFIESRNENVIELAGKAEPVAKQTVQTAKIDIAENNLRKTEIKEPDVLLSPQSLERGKKSQTVKLVQKDQNPQLQLQVEPVKVALKKESKSQPKSERLRRAEKILTGF